MFKTALNTLLEPTIFCEFKEEITFEISSLAVELIQTHLAFITGS